MIQLDSGERSMLMAQVSSASESEGVQTMEPNHVAPRPADAFPRPPLTFATTLTSQEASVLAMIDEGSANRDTAEVLGIGIGPRTVEFHRANIMQKAAAPNAVDLIRIL